MAAAPGSARLGVTVASTVPIPADVCGGTPQLGDGFGISVVASGGNKPSYKVVTMLSKSETQKKPGNPSASGFDICLGARNVEYAGPNVTPVPLTDCDQPATDRSWKTKNGTCAVPRFGPGGIVYYWGLVADYPSAKPKSCPTAPNSNLFPGVISKNKTGAGVEQITFCKPYPWDGAGAHH